MHPPTPVDSICSCGSNDTSPSVSNLQYGFVRKLSKGRTWRRRSVGSPCVRVEQPFFVLSETRRRLGFHSNLRNLYLTFQSLSSRRRHSVPQLWAWPDRQDCDITCRDLWSRIFPFLLGILITSNAGSAFAGPSELQQTASEATVPCALSQ